MSIPRWLLDVRHGICATCENMKSCKDKFTILEENPTCPLGKLRPTQDMVAEKAWPSRAKIVSGCCDSAKNYPDFARRTK